MAHSSSFAIALPLLVTAVTACSSSSSSGPGGATADASNDAPARTMHYGVLIVGTLASDDATAQAHHDGLAKAGQDAANEAGDVGHDVFLGTTTLGTAKDELLALDRWIDGADYNGFYANPDFAKGFAALFSGPPSVTAYVVQPTWRTWGSLDVADRSTPHTWVVIRGTMQSNDFAKNQATHDAIAANAETQATGAGDRGHTVFVGREDPTQFLAIDTWTDTTNLEAFYSDAGFQKAFESFFAAPPKIGVYASTNWYQW
jgi:quinol monooxygenase YgiN